MILGVKLIPKYGDPSSVSEVCETIELLYQSYPPTTPHPAVRFYGQVGITTQVSQGLVQLSIPYAALPSKVNHS